MTMASADYPRCENCGRPTTAASLNASDLLPGWVGGPFCDDCVRLAQRLVEARPGGGDAFEPGR